MKLDILHGDVLETRNISERGFVTVST
jgi:hypothetical protein